MGMTQLHIVIIDSSDSSRLCLRLLLEHAGHHVSYEFASLAAYQQAKMAVVPDLLCIDCGDASGQLVVEYCAYIDSISYQLPILFITQSLAVYHLVALYETCAKGIVYKENLGALSRALTIIQQGRRYFDEEIASRLLEFQSICQYLSLAERRTFMALLSCDTVRNIAESLSMADRTVRSHKQSIILKVGRRCFDKFMCQLQ